jgi:hypothetical protein
MGSRNPRLRKIFDDIVSGEKQLSDPLIPHFIQSISTHPDPAACLHTLVTSEHGLKAVQTTVCSNLSVDSLNGGVAALLSYLRDSKLEYLGGGATLQRLLRALVEAPGFWDSLVIAFGARQLQQSTERSFSWLFFQLVVSPPELAEEYRNVALDTDIVRSLLRSPDPETLSNARKINHIVSLYSYNEVVPPDWLEAPGWRHSNDSHSYREISILPTSDEINSTDRPHLRTVDQIDDLKLTSPIEMLMVHVENQFRLLREDLVHDTRENVQVALGNRKGKRIGEPITDLFLTNIYTDEKSKWGLKFTCSKDLPFFSFAFDYEDRRARLENERNYLRHGSFACLLSGSEIIAFVTIIRDVNLLAQDPPAIAVQLGGRANIKDILFQLRRCSLVSLVQINTPLFAYEPVLRGLQMMRPSRFLFDGILLAKPHRSRSAPGDLSDINQESVPDLVGKLTATGTRKPVTLDDAQMEAFFCGLTQEVALIQGPPGIHFRCYVKSLQIYSRDVGTGKSFIGALLVKAFHQLTNYRIVVCCYTNHALDQFLEDLLGHGVPEGHMVRLGSKPSPRTQSMGLSTQTFNYRFGLSDWETINGMRFSLDDEDNLLRRAFSGFQEPLSPSKLLDHLESKYPTYFQALSVPPSDDDMVLVGEFGRAIGSTYLLSRWLRGQDAGVLREHPNTLAPRAQDLWGLPLEERKVLEDTWAVQILEDQMEAILEAGESYNDFRAPINKKFQESTRQVLLSKRIIACTTTGAATFRDAIHNARPEIIIVEEAGEVLECHVLAAICRDTKQLILIGDHKCVVVPFSSRGV